MSVVQPFEFFAERTLAEKPQLAIVIGSGLGPATFGMQVLNSIPYSQIPGMSAPSVPGHEGQLKLGNWGGKRVLVFEGRLHFYEGHSWDLVTRPARMAQSLGVRIFLATNAAGGIHPGPHSGSFLAIREHLDWTRPIHWRAGLLSDRSLRQTETACSDINTAPPYSSRLLNLIRNLAARMKLELLSGTYAAVTGPNYETPAEVRALRSRGADAVGMSTAREIQIAHDLGMECAAISCITNRAAGLDRGAAITHHEVLQSAKTSCRQLNRLIEEFIERVSL
jgi:purine-nucleoside phosphorylase